MDVSKLKNVEKDVSAFKSLFDGQDYKDVLNDVRGAYLGEKPVSSIELYNITQDIEEWVERMEAYFFVRVRKIKKSKKEFSGEIYISRFKTIGEVALKSRKSRRFKLGKVKYREYADLDGLLHGYSPEEIYDYCVEQGLMHLIK